MVKPQCGSEEREKQMEKKHLLHLNTNYIGAVRFVVPTIPSYGICKKHGRYFGLRQPAQGVRSVWRRGGSFDVVFGCTKSAPFKHREPVG